MVNLNSSIHNICFKDEDKLKEECGVFGIFSNEDISIGDIMYYGLSALQHRGEESAGIAVSSGGSIKCYKDMGLVSEVFHKHNLIDMEGNVAVGHVRYSTTGDSNIVNAQPILDAFSGYHIGIAHNGNLTNTKELREYLNVNEIKIQTTTDSELILKLILKQLEHTKYISDRTCLKSNNIAYSSINGIDIKNEIPQKLYNATIDAVKRVEGAYSFVLLTQDSVIGVRDPLGIRPLCIGKIDNVYIICSESCALSSIGANFIRDIEPGEIVEINKEGIKSTKFVENVNHKTCSFEYIYFSREDSIIDGVSVYKSRVLSGKKLYEESPVSADLVIGVPDSGIPAALGYSKAAGIPYEIGFIKNKYVGRSFILPYDKMRDRTVSVKLSPLKEVLKDKKVVVVDDSIVRGTNIKKIVRILKESGVREIHLRIASPPIKNCCFLGINISKKQELIASDKEIEQIRQIIGVDSLSYISLTKFTSVLGNSKNLCLGCFNGQYPKHVIET